MPKAPGGSFWLVPCQRGTMRLFLCNRREDAWMKTIFYLHGYGAVEATRGQKAAADLATEICDLGEVTGLPRLEENPVVSGS